MTAPRPEAVELATKLLAITGLDAKKVPTETAVWSALIDAALTAAREEQREKDAAVIDKIAGREHGRDQSIMLLCARAIREGR